jgi:hypothetical protein
MQVPNDWLDPKLKGFRTVKYPDLWIVISLMLSKFITIFNGSDTRNAI